MAIFLKRLNRITCGKCFDMSSKQSAQTTGTKSQTVKDVQATEEEKKLNQLDLELREKAQPQLLNLQDLSLALSGQLAQGGTLPGYLQPLPGGISPEVTNRLAGQAVDDVNAQLQTSGLLDSGARAELGAETAAGIRTQAEEFNLNLLSQLLNAALGGSASATQTSVGVGSTLGQRLAGLRNERINTKSRTNSFYKDLEMGMSMGGMGGS